MKCIFVLLFVIFIQITNLVFFFFFFFVKMKCIFVLLDGPNKYNQTSVVLMN
ncbi:hypothetical protein HanIR_Chr07g0319781 [Helianthus annuus]|nr:hypothetical protein HanIR_Chr07g0319781 [Helianthus annuus]